jgi:hypothetical protein
MSTQLSKRECETNSNEFSCDQFVFNSISSIENIYMHVNDSYVSNSIVKVRKYGSALRP